MKCDNKPSSVDQRETDMQRLSKLNSELQKQLAASSEQLQNLKKARNVTRKFSSAVRMVSKLEMQNTVCGSLNCHNKVRIYFLKVQGQVSSSMLYLGLLKLRKCR